MAGAACAERKDLRLGLVDVVDGPVGYPYDFLEQVLWAMNETTGGILELVTSFASGKEQAAGGGRHDE